MNTAKFLDGLISQNPTLHSGRPVIDGTGITVRAIAGMYKQGLTPEEMTVELPVTLAQVYAALTYYHLNSSKIEDDILADAEASLLKKYGNTLHAVDG